MRIEDNTGPFEFNERLSRQRADSVKETLVAAGANPDRIIVKGFAASRPVADNGIAEGRAKNRRVQITIPK